MGHDHTIHARRMESTTAVVGALLVALIALGRTSHLMPLRDIHWELIVCPSSYFSDFFPHLFLCNLSHSGLARVLLAPVSSTF